MSIYQKIAAIGSKYIGKDKLFKYGFNLSPMYRRSTGRLTEVSKDLLHIKMKLPLSYKNRNYVNSIFGGSLFSAVDPIPMVQLINIIGDEYVVWDKSAQVFFKRPAKENVYAEFTYTLEEVEEIKADVEKNNEIEIIKTTFITSKDKSIVYCEVRKTIYVATKQYYREKRKRRTEQKR
ncbi:DUF4442 domain-containing protein [Bernardetia sp. ABR2-2B]|uniref:DUF4442 domain-containing protein n=1 Tax=Bernardetia sp. ABR2-2B TaxID=3127472 RepID=UPI0030D0803A